MNWLTNWDRQSPIKAWFMDTHAHIDVRTSALDQLASGIRKLNNGRTWAIGSLCTGMPLSDDAFNAFCGFVLLHDERYLGDLASATRMFDRTDSDWFWLGENVVSLLQLADGAALVGVEVSIWNWEDYGVGYMQSALPKLWARFGNDYLT